MFPGLGEGVIWTCLRFFNGRADRTIDCILTGAFPPELKTVRRDLTLYERFVSLLHIVLS